ncbi:winged helix-turn-helix domain-containing protein [Marisediminicola sp. UYEF4]
MRSYIRYLRQKLGVPAEPDIIQTRRGDGYLIAADK